MQRRRSWPATRRTWPGRALTWRARTLKWRRRSASAPESGFVGERKVRAGQVVSPGTQVISLVQHNVWVQANYKETQVRHMQAGDPATIRVDAFPGVVLNGKVDHVAPASGSQFALLPPDKCDW